MTGGLVDPEALGQKLGLYLYDTIGALTILHFHPAPQDVVSTSTHRTGATYGF